MPQSAWATFANARNGRHLVVVEVPADVSTAAAALVGLLSQRLAPTGDCALRHEPTAESTRLFRAFAEPSEADLMIQATNAQEEKIYSGWASEIHCRLDRAAAEAILETGAARDIING
jgi:hypothetical protein